MIIDNNTTLNIFASRYLDTVSISELIEWVDDPDPKVRTLVARKLQCRGTREVFEFAKQWAISTLDYQRELAAFILGQLGCLFDDDKKYPFKSETKPILMSLINDENHEVRAAVIAGFGHLYNDLDNDIEKAVLNYANDKNEEVRIAVALTLGGSSGNQKVREVYSQYLEEDNEVSEWAEVGLEILEERLANDPPTIM